MVLRRIYGACPTLANDWAQMLRDIPRPVALGDEENASVAYCVADADQSGDPNTRTTRTSRPAMTTAIGLQENRFEVRWRSPGRSLPVDDRESRRAAAARIRPVV
jgi:hypothetical protein